MTTKKVEPVITYTKGRIKIGDHVIAVERNAGFGTGIVGYKGPNGCFTKLHPKGEVETIAKYVRTGKQFRDKYGCFQDEFKYETTSKPRKWKARAEFEKWAGKEVKRVKPSVLNAAINEGIREVAFNTAKENLENVKK